ncbi:MAG: PP2C family protein-serine/threonine phosphatase [Candidatus Kapaibacterium sp.]
MPKLNKLVFLVAGIIFFLVRLTGDMLLYSLDMSKGDAAVYWYFISTAAIFVSFGVYFLKDVSNDIVNKSGTSGDNFLNSIYQTFVLSLIIVLLLIFFSFRETAELFQRAYLGIILADFIFIYTVVVSMVNFQFTYKWLWFKRHRLTRFYLFLITMLISIVIANDIAYTFIGNDAKTWLSKISSGMFLIMYVVTFLANKKTAWIANLPRPQKTKFFWMLFLNILIVIWVLMEVSNEDSMVFSNFYIAYPMTISLMAASFVFYGVYLFRNFMSLLAVLPSSVIVERKSSEINTLTYLNKIVAESATNDRKTLLDTVAGLALQACNAHGAWTEIYTNDNNIIGSCINISPPTIFQAHKVYNIDSFFIKIERPQLIESVHEIKELEGLTKLAPDVKSLIVIPLSTSAKREGSLIVFDSEDFSLEQDDLNILTAFGDNVRIALENSRLLHESVEKERYRNELMLARNMQSKLLPQKISQPESYSVSAFSIPAMEVGGDYYDMVKLKNGNYCLLIGDVSGKGISAAFYMAQLKGVVLSKASESENVKELLSKINITLYKNMESQMFITMSALSFNIELNNISIARAGHMPFYHKSGTDIFEYIPKGIGIGLTDDKIFDKYLEQIDVLLDEGDTILMFTDGLNEMRNTEGDEFGTDKLKQFFLESEKNDSHELIDSFKSHLEDFSKNAKHHDDMTVLFIMRDKL